MCKGLVRVNQDFNQVGILLSSKFANSTVEGERNWDTGQGSWGRAGQGGALLSKQPEVGEAERDQPVPAVDSASLSWQHRKYTHTQIEIQIPPQIQIQLATLSGR